MYCKGEKDGVSILHSDQYRGLQYSYASKGHEPGATIYAEPIRITSNMWILAA